MTAERLSVFVTRKLPSVVQTRMTELFRTTLNSSDTPCTRAQLLEAVQNCDVLVPTVTDSIDAEVIAAAGPRLKLIANFGVGVDHIDLKAARAKKILVTNTPDVLTEDTADITMALLLSVARRFAEGERRVRSGAWEGWSPTAMLGHRVWGKRLGIIGMGRIGQAVARRANGFGIAVHYHNRSPVAESIENELQASYWADLDDMLQHMDIISLNAPATQETHYILNRERLAKLQPHALVINTARGDLIDEEALADALIAGKIAGAGLDVYEHEPRVTPRLLDLNNVVLLPHLGSATFEGRVEMGERVIINIRSFADGHAPRDRVVGSF
jgi:glyoxylate reductase